jgi:hypothetical protein
MKRVFRGGIPEVMVAETFIAYKEQGLKVW